VTFDKLKSDFQDYAILQTQISVLQVKFISLSVVDKLDEIGELVIIVYDATDFQLISSYENGTE
jgi:hypothetical protein